MKSKYFLAALSFYLLHITSLAQPVIRTQHTIGGSSNDNFRSMDITKDRGLIIGGNSNSGISGEKTNDLTGGWLVKLNKQGFINWDTTYDTYNYGGKFISIRHTRDGGFILVGSVYDQLLSYSLPVMIKTDSLGNVQWFNNIITLQTFTEQPVSIQQLNNKNGYVLATIFYFTSIIYWLDSVGNIKQQTIIPQYGGAVLFETTCFQQTRDGGLIVGGDVYGSYTGGQSDFGIVKLDNKGQTVWQKVIGGDNTDNCTAIEQINDGSYIVGGYSNSNISKDKSEKSKGSFDYWIVQLDSTGNIISDKTIGGPGDDRLHALVKTSDGGFIAGGTSLSDAGSDKTENSRGGSDYWVVKMKNKQIEWDKTIGGDQNDALYSIQEAKENEYVLGGSSISGISGDKTEQCRGGYDYWIVELSSANLIANTSNKQVKSPSIAKDFYVYPNPANNLLHIKAGSISDFTLKDQTGKIVLAKTINGSDIINISTLSTGIYFIENNTTGIVRKVIISR